MPLRASEKQHARISTVSTTTSHGAHGVALAPDIARTHTAHDQRDMQRMGKTQEFRRNFRVATSIAFTSCVMGTWEILLTSNTSALTAGGLAGLFWQYIWCYVGQTFVVLSLSEMSSMAPTAGGQYHWVSEFAQPAMQRALSYASGWLSTLAWQSFVAVDSYICATLIQALITLNNPAFEPQRWQTTLLMIAVVSSMGAFNVFFANRLALIEGFFAVLHFVAWIPIVAVLWTMTPVKQSAKAVFTEFTDNGAGWNSTGLTVCVGQVGAMFTIVGSDAAAHIAEEIRDAGIVVPRSMWWAFIINIPIALIVLISYCFCTPPDIPATIADSSGFPLIAVFLNTTGSRVGATALTAIMLLLLLIIATSCMASTIRQTFAFARDNGMVFSPWIAKVNQRFAVPANAVLFTVAFSIIMSLVNIGSTTAFNAFLSVSVVALMATYTLSIACVLVKRLRHQPLPHARWTVWGENARQEDTGSGGLGKYGPFVNIMAMVYSVWAFFWSFWPIYSDLTPQNMNWAIVIFAGSMVIAAIAFLVHARKTYAGPVSTVQEVDDESLREEA